MASRRKQRARSLVVLSVLIVVVVCHRIYKFSLSGDQWRRRAREGERLKGKKSIPSVRPTHPPPFSLSPLPTLHPFNYTALLRIATWRFALTQPVSERAMTPSIYPDRSMVVAAAPADDDDDDEGDSGGGGGDDSWQCNIHSRIPGILRALLPPSLADSASVRPRRGTTNLSNPIWLLG